jgi:hypothetical protein
MNVVEKISSVDRLAIAESRGSRQSRSYENGRQNAKRLYCIKSDSKKEVFQPHLPVRLPCYDLAPVTSFALGRSSRSRTSGTPGFHGLTGGVYKARERIHRAVADARLLANPASWSRVADSESELRRLLEISALSPGELPFVTAIVTRVSPRT